MMNISSMINNIKRITALISALIFSSGISGQVPSGMMESITLKFQDYCRSYPWEEIFVHTDREEYIVGENIWFKVYLLDRQSSRLSSESSIAYFEILNSDRRPVIQKRIKLEAGSGPGEIRLPDTLSSGHYLIRAYTNWMKNFFPSNCFMKQITVYNAVKNLPFRGISSQLSTVTNPEETKGPATQGSMGVNIKVGNSGSESFAVEIETDQNFRSLNGTSFFLFIQTHGIINYKSLINLKADLVREYIPQETLIPGLNQLVLFNQKGKPVADKFIFTPLKETSLISLSAPGKIEKREKATVTIALDNISISSAEKTSLSISVAESTGKKSAGIADYMVFGSEFGIIPDEIRNSLIEKIPDGIPDRFLSVLKSNWIDWDIILSGNYPVLKYDREKLYHYLTGKLILQDPQTSTDGSFLFLSIPGKSATFKYAKADRSGNFSFNLPVNDGLKDLIIQPEYADKGINIKMESSFSEIYPDYQSSRGGLDADYQKMISRQGTNFQVRKIYESDNPASGREPEILGKNPRRFYGKPDIELIMDDYIKLPVMQEVFFELMPGVFLKKKKSVYEITIADPISSRIFDKPPVLLVDGVVIKDPAIIAELDPEAVEEIDAVKERYMVGDYLFFGIVNVITRAGDFSGITLPDNAVRLPYRVTDPLISFTSPDYSDYQMKISRIPDFRNTLYWNPAVTFSNEGKAGIDFWASDSMTDYIINIQGITVEGKPLSFSGKMSVK